MIVAVTIAAILLAVLLAYFGVSAVIAFSIAVVRRYPISKTPADLNTPYEDISFHSRIDRVLLKGWFLPGGTRGTIIVVHGGKQNRADATIRLLELCRDMARQGFNIITFDRRGCGESGVSGIRARTCFERDIGGAVDFAKKRCGFGEKIFCLCFSLGALASFIFAAGGSYFSGIVSDSCFASTPEMAKRTIGKRHKILELFLPGALWMGKLVFGYSPASAMGKVGLINCPIFFIHGEEDDGVPVRDANRLFYASDNRRNELWIVPEAGHCQPYICVKRKPVFQHPLFKQV